MVWFGSGLDTKCWQRKKKRARFTPAALLVGDSRSDSACSFTLQASLFGSGPVSLWYIGKRARPHLHRRISEYPLRRRSYVFILTKCPHGVMRSWEHKFDGKTIIKAMVDM